MKTIYFSTESLSDVLTTLYEECAAIGAAFEIKPYESEIFLKLPDRTVRLKALEVLDAYDISRELFSKK